MVKRLEDRSQKTEVGRPESGVRRPKTEVGRPESEVKPAYIFVLLYKLFSNFKMILIVPIFSISSASHFLLRSSVFPHLTSHIRHQLINFRYVSISLSPLPERLITTTSVGLNVIFGKTAKACADSSAGIIPSSLMSSRAASRASWSVMA